MNTRYSREEERQLTGDVVKLIMGQFAHHGEYFYRLELEKTTEELNTDPANVEARNDRAVAWLKLGEYDKAEQELLSIEKTHPGRYRTHANLGVLYKKMGRLPEAAASVRRSLEIRPEGHLGLGDYYVRMIDWLNDCKNFPLDLRWHGNPEDGRRIPPTMNFLGIAYTNGWSATATNPLVNREYLETLIKADRSFADAVFVLGDVLAHAGEKELAYRAYVQAFYDLDHPAGSALRKRMQDIHREWQVEAKMKAGYIVLPGRKLISQLGVEAKLAAHWVDDFEKTETQLLKQGRTPDFNAVKAEMAAQQKLEPSYIFAGVVKGSKSEQGRGSYWVAAFAFLSV
ncbi:MAG: tetratricopeptide repeat protein, partial [Limisphaerales bacterium]